MNGQQHLFLTVFPEGYQGYAIDVGANDGTFLSNTLALEQIGWRVLCIEPNPLYAPVLWRDRKDVVICAAGAKQERKTFYTYLTANNEFASKSGLLVQPGDRPLHSFPVSVEPLDLLLDVWKPPQLDLLTIDVEGTEEDVLRGFDIARWLPKIICVEDLQRTQRLGNLLTPHGYKFHSCFNDDEVYIR